MVLFTVLHSVPVTVCNVTVSQYSGFISFYYYYYYFISFCIALAPCRLNGWDNTSSLQGFCFSYYYIFSE